LSNFTKQQVLDSIVANEPVKLQDIDTSPHADSYDDFMECKKVVADHLKTLKSEGIIEDVVIDKVAHWRLV